MPRCHQTLNIAESLVGPIFFATDNENHLSGPGAVLGLDFFNADRTSAGVMLPRWFMEGSRSGVTPSPSSKVVFSSLSPVNISDTRPNG